jgi:hypothetical protein
VAGLLLAVIHCFQVHKKDYYRVLAHGHLVEVISTIDGFADEQDLYLELVNAAHEPAFERSYRMYRERRSARGRPNFQRDDYRTYALQAMVNGATARGREDIALLLARVQTPSP